MLQPLLVGSGHSGRRCRLLLAGPRSGIESNPPLCAVEVWIGSVVVVAGVVVVVVTAAAAEVAAVAAGVVVGVGLVAEVGVAAVLVEAAEAAVVAGDLRLFELN